MSKFESILQLDDLVHESMISVTPLISEFKKSNKIPNTFISLINFVFSTNSIKLGIFDLYEGESLYPVKILYRSLIEHFLRFQYIFTRYAEEKTDESGEDYLNFGSLNDYIEIGKAWKKVAEILGKNPKTDPYKAVFDLNEKYKDYTKEIIDNKKRLFQYKHIIEHLNQKTKHLKDFSDIPFILKIIPAYSELSSFVHGGPSAHEVMASIKPENIKNEIIEIAEMAFLITSSIKKQTFLILYMHDKRFGKAYLEIDEIVKKFTLME